MLPEDDDIVDDFGELVLVVGDNDDADETDVGEDSAEDEDVGVSFLFAGSPFLCGILPSVIQYHKTLGVLRLRLDS